MHMLHFVYYTLHSLAITYLLPWIMISGNFQGRKLSWINRKGAFREENFHRMLKVVAHNGCGMPKISCTKISWTAKKSQDS